MFSPLCTLEGTDHTVQYFLVHQGTGGALAHSLTDSPCSQALTFQYKQFFQEIFTGMHELIFASVALNMMFTKTYTENLQHHRPETFHCMFFIIYAVRHFEKNLEFT